MWSVFSRLGSYLAAQGRAGSPRLTLTFAAMEEILGRPLPVHARTDPEWWGNAPGGTRGRIGAHYRRYGWLSGGWQAEPDLAAGAVTFHRRGEDTP